MRIGIDCRMYSSQFTGIGRYVYELVDHLLKIDHKNEYVLFFNEPEFSKFKIPGADATGAAAHTAGAHPIAAQKTAHATHQLTGKVKKILVNARHYSLNEQIKFLYLINREKLDLMHFTHFNAPIFYRKPSVVTIHDLTLSFFPGKKMTSPLHRLAYQITFKTAVNKAKKIITVSQNTKKDLQNLLHTPSEKIEVIYEGVHEKFKPLRGDANAAGTGESLIKAVKEKYKLNSEYLLYTGVWRTHKNLTNLIRAFSILKKDYQYSGQLVITGRADPLYANEIYKLAADLNVIEDIKFTGMVDEQDLVPLYNGALIYVFPSLYEGFGLSPLEAMQCGVPTVVSNSSCIPEVCGAENAVYFDPENPADIAKKIWEVASSKALREKLVTNGLAHVKKFSWQKMAQQTLAVYNKILDI